MKQRSALLLAALLIPFSACTKNDAAGRELTATEIAALGTCNEFLVSKMRGTVGSIDPSEATFGRVGDNQLDIAWFAETSSGFGGIVCSTNASGRRVIGGQIDGIKFVP